MSQRMFNVDTNATHRPKEPESEATTEDGSSDGIPLWIYIACGLVVCAIGVFAVLCSKKGAP